ncbi:MAG: carboxymuconolactone decarboxylase family protein [Solirubrobacteraceae bacterium]
MARVPPLDRREVAELDDVFAQVQQRMGFVPNSMLTMARRPELVRAFGALSRAVRSGTVDPVLKEMVALVASTASGCRYCQAHTASNAVAGGDRAGNDTMATELEDHPLALASDVLGGVGWEAGKHAPADRAAHRQPK